MMSASQGDEYLRMVFVGTLLKSVRRQRLV